MTVGMKGAAVKPIASDMDEARDQRSCLKEATMGGSATWLTFSKHSLCMTMTKL